MTGMDKFDNHYRQQLSALMDGALPPDEARFLLRRLQHDTELAQCLDRWHMAGDALRGEPQAIVSNDFAGRIAAMVADEPALAPVAVGAARGNRGGLRWAGGAALAASVALVALFATRQSAAPDQTQLPAAVAVTSSGTGNSAVAVDAPATVPVSAAMAPPIVDASRPDAGIATATAPPRSVRRGSRAQNQRATIRTPTRSERPMVAASQGGEGVLNGVFDTPATTRPWPSAVFPQAGATGSFNVGYGSVSSSGASSPTFYPFEPRLPDGPSGNDVRSAEEAPAP